MKITIWGCRGSLPIPGPGTIRYGGNTTCVEVKLDDGNLIIFDSGSGIRMLGQRIVKEGGPKEINLILTHSHWDHLMGFPFFIPAYISAYKINIKGGPIAKETLRKNLEYQMEPPYFPVQFSYMKANFDFTHGIPKVRQIGDAEITPIALSHPNGGYGFKVEENGTTFVFLTDNELKYKHEHGASMYEYINFCRDADLVFHDAQYTMEEYEKYESWGHSTYKDAIDLAINAKARQLGLFHHDPDHNDEGLDRIIDACHAALEKRKSKLTCFACREGQTISI